MMRLGIYIFVALTLMALTGAFVYTVNPDNYLLEIMGINFNFPVAVWIILPMFLLFLFTVAHMLLHNIKSYFKLKKWQKDASTLEDGLYWSLVNEPKEQKYGVEEIAKSASLLGKSSLTITDGIEDLSPRLSKTLNIINKIKSGEYIDLKENKMAKVFSEGNPLLVKNRLNRLESDDKFVESVMKSPASYSELVQGQALKIFANKETFYKARKHAKTFDVANFKTMLHRVTTDDDLGLNGEILNDFVSELDLKCSDFVEIADVTKKHFAPDENLSLFREYQKENANAQNAYLYLLFEYELQDQVATYLEEHEDHEFIKFRALHALKKDHKNYRIEDLISKNTIC